MLPAILRSVLFEGIICQAQGQTTQAADLKLKTDFVPFEVLMPAGQNSSPSRHLATVVGERNFQLWGQTYVDAGPDATFEYTVTRANGEKVEIVPPKYGSQVDHGFSVDVIVHRNYVRVAQTFRSQVAILDEH